jgi:hypothetical protein
MQLGTILLSTVVLAGSAIGAPGAAARSVDNAPRDTMVTGRTYTFTYQNGGWQCDNMAAANFNDRQLKINCADGEVDVWIAENETFDIGAHVGVYQPGALPPNMLASCYDQSKTSMYCAPVVMP